MRRANLIAQITLAATGLLFLPVVAKAQTCSQAQQIGSHDNKPYKGESPHTVSIFTRLGRPGAFYLSKLEVDADGAPNAYNLDDKRALDYKSDAGYPTSCNVLVCLKPSHPEVGFAKTVGGQFDGYFVSQTSLKSTTLQAGDYHKYVDASHVPYLAIPPSSAKIMGTKKGDIAMVVNIANGKQSPAIFADGGTEHTLGEGSVALANALGINTSAKNGGTGYHVLYIVFPKTRLPVPWPRDAKSINDAAEAAFSEWGGLAMAKACAGDVTSGKLN